VSDVRPLGLPKGSSLEVRLFYRRRVTESGCWEYTGSVNPHGYGRITFEGKHVLTHRASYELFVGPIAEGLQIDHLCRNRACFNPEHLEPVTHRENVRRGQRHAVTHCPKGHEYAGDNLYLQQGKRSCKTCRSEHFKAWKRRQRNNA
jgi:hypothetical protein